MEGRWIVQKAHYEWLEFLHRNSSFQERNRNKIIDNIGEVKWSLAAEGCIKLNTSTILKAHKSKGSCAFAARNHEGRLIVARDWLNQNIKVKDLLEEETILLTLEFAKDKGWRNVEVQVECVHLVNKLKRKNSRDRELKLLLDDIICFSDWFCKCSFTILCHYGSSMSHLILNA
ncbi:hypothetical protein ACH5RR_017308 [Cinchona calisaya]|uniref:RNase H type-1 domain-containing protein n=1 Tax=Cinchona calisaya TaxID=153742 RepID=A0ABD2ZYD5_9GENT